MDREQAAEVAEVLKRKLQVYKAADNENSASIVQGILKEGVLAVKATQRVNLFDPHRGTGARKKLIDLPTPMELRNRDAKSGRPRTGAMMLAIVEKMAEDPAYAAEILLEARRPGKHSKARHHISARAACKEPMLNASPDSIRNGLAYNEPSHKGRLVKGQKYADLIVKPTTLAASKADGVGSWVERRWQVFSLRYSSGYIIVTDKGSESRVFPTYGELRSALNKSGWQVVS